VALFLVVGAVPFVAPELKARWLEQKRKKLRGEWTLVAMDIEFVKGQNSSGLATVIPYDGVRVQGDTEDDREDGTLIVAPGRLVGGKRNEYGELDFSNGTELRGADTKSTSSTFRLEPGPGLFGTPRLIVVSPDTVDDANETTLETTEINGNELQLFGEGDQDMGSGTMLFRTRLHVRRD
jgi:hypothetical protein